jgi:hypothetical protein
MERQNQVKLFQVKIPREAKNIIGVEMGFRWMSGVMPSPVPVTGFPPALVGSMPVIIRRNQIVGELKLQSYEKANVFYTGELAIDQNSDNCDITSEKFIPRVYTHQLESQEDQVIVNGNATLIRGAFRDKLLNAAGSFQYKVFIYLWVEAKEDQSNL